MPARSRVNANSQSGLDGRAATTWVLLALTGVVVISVLLPNTAIAWMREHWTWFNRPMIWIENLHSQVNLVHLLLFLPLGTALQWAWPDARMWRAASVLLLLGLSTELVQVWVPGRHPRVTDILVDVAAGMLGWGLAWAWSHWRARKSGRAGLA